MTAELRRRDDGATDSRALEASIGRLLTLGTYVSLALIVVGTLLLAAAGTSPLASSQPFAAGGIVPDLLALRPAGFLWLGIVVMLATPAARVAAALVGYWRRGERVMAIVSALVLGVVALGVVVGVMAG